MTNLKKFVTMAILAAMMTVPLAGCGGSDTADSTDDTVVEHTTADSSASSSSSSDDALSDDTFNALQTQYSGLVELYNLIKAAHDSGEITLDDTQTTLFNEAADVINEMGELEQSDFASEDEAVELSETIADIAQGLSDIYDAAANEGTIPSASDGITDETFASVQEAYGTLTDLYNTVKTAVESGAITPTTEQTNSINEVADLINEMGELTKDDFDSEKDAIDLLTAMGQLADTLGAAAE